MTVRNRNIDPESSTPDRLKWLENFINQRLPGAIANTVKPIVSNLQTTIQNLLAANYYTAAQITANFAAKVHQHSWSDITSTGTTGAGGTIGGNLTVTGTITGQSTVSGTALNTSGRMTANGGVTSSDVRNRTLSTGYAAVYVDSSGVFGISPSTASKKTVTGGYVVDMQKWLALPIHTYYYNDDQTKTPRIGFIADDLVAAGLTEFVQYDTVGNLQGLMVDQLVYGVLSAYEQSRQSTLARIAKQAHQTVTVTSMAAISLGGTATYKITWPAAFADTDYMVVASVTTTTGVVVAGAVAAVTQSSKTTTGCTVTVAAGIALLAGQTLTVEGLHV